MASEYPHPVGGRIADSTNQLLQDAKRSGATEGALVRMALEDYLPRYIAGRVGSEQAEVVEKVREAIRRRPSLVAQIQELLVSSARPSRRNA